ncbi:MAG: Trm112 family protein [Candidatus Poribacteria bacterium]
MINKELLEILVCPADKGDIIYDEENEKLICKKCGRKYPIKDGIPIMLIEKAEMPDKTDS